MKPSSKLRDGNSDVRFVVLALQFKPCPSRAGERVRGAGDRGLTPKSVSKTTEPLPSRQGFFITMRGLMKTKELIEILKKMPPDAEVFVNGIEVSGAEIRKGRVRQDFTDPDKHFVMLERGKDEAVVLTHTTHLSNGEMAATPYFYVR